MGLAVCERHPRAALALIVEAADGAVRNWTFGHFLRREPRLANALSARASARATASACPGQGAELTDLPLAGYRIGAVVLPLFPLFGEKRWNLPANAEHGRITDTSQLPKVLAVRDRLPHRDHRGDRRRRQRQCLPRLGPPAGAASDEPPGHDRWPRIQRC